MTQGRSVQWAPVPVSARPTPDREQLFVIPGRYIQRPRVRAPPQGVALIQCIHIHRMDALPRLIANVPLIYIFSVFSGYKGRALPIWKVTVGWELGVSFRIAVQ